MGEYGTRVAAGTVRFERLLPGPVERVWAYLTESDKRARWLAAGDMDLREGGRVELTFRNGELASDPAPEKYRAQAAEVPSQGRVTRCEPPRLLAFTWDEAEGPPSEVTFELTSQGDRVRLVLTHSRLRDRAIVLDVSGGWHVHLAVLEDRLSEREPRPFWATLAAAEAEYAQRYAS